MSGACSSVTERINFSQWTLEDFQPIEGCPSADWTLQSNGFKALQTQNGQPSMFCSQENVFDLFDNNDEGVTITGQVEVLPPNDIPPICQALGANKDDDYWGFALGYNPGDNALGGTDADYLLVDWKARDQTYSESCEGNGACQPCQCNQNVAGWDEATTGLAVSRVKGLIHVDEFWSHRDCECGNAFPGRIDEYARGDRNFDNKWKFRGQRGGETYKFRFDINPEEFTMYVDDWNNPEIRLNYQDAGGQFFQDGKLCFYNYSQENVRYFGFRAEENCSNPPVDPPDDCSSGKGKGKGKGGSKGGSCGKSGKGKGKSGKGKSGGQGLTARQKRINRRKRVAARTAGIAATANSTEAVSSSEVIHDIFADKDVGEDNEENENEE